MTTLMANLLSRVIQRNRKTLKNQAMGLQAGMPIKYISVEMRSHMKAKPIVHSGGHKATDPANPQFGCLLMTVMIKARPRMSRLGMPMSFTYEVMQSSMKVTSMKHYGGLKGKSRMNRAFG